MAPLISILLPIFNAESLLSDCFESIKTQTIQDYEVIVVNDGSSDNTSKRLNELSDHDARIRVFSFEKNQGIVSALNFGLNQCRAQWIARMDADDLMKPKRLEKQLAYMKQYPDVDILGCQVEVVRLDGDLTPGQIRYQNWSNSLLTDEQIKREIFAESPIMHPSFFLSRQVYDTLKGYSSHPWAEDYDFLLKAFTRTLSFAKLPEVLLIKRDHPTRVVRVDDRCKRKAMYQAKAHYFNQLPIIQEGKKIFVIGTGPSGKQVAIALKSKQISVGGFVHQHRHTHHKMFMGAPLVHLSEDNASEFFLKHRDVFFLLAVGKPNAKKLLENILAQNKLKPGVHFYKFI